MKWAFAIAVTLTAATVVGGCSQGPKMSKLNLQPAQDAVASSPSAGLGDALGLGQYGRRGLPREPMVTAEVYPQ
jgi:hypothetical protein